ncbi:substrate-binding domain-containing protein [Opitutus sp. GAS368]|uniref:PstS family phosphate ABC transporter substrate-binding protein n=1 Tax=Opitutus sp. GAS368 TaxID=1882749 RepID=UPI00087DA2C0|nr:substrate-binding domain-containing protein [Opitutus sp. GAS368]SDR90445.1 phosphate transport system substrate-binding protein [Opitutus sp. GAS368]
MTGKTNLGLGKALALGGMLLAAASVRATEPDLPPAYRPSRPVTGTIRSWGHGFLRPMMKLWEEGFQKYHPGVRFKDKLVTSAAAMAGLYTQRADLGVLAREITPPEVAAYEKMVRQKLTPVTVLTGSYGNQDKIMALGIFVNQDNPVSRLTFAQLDAIWGAEHKRGAKANIRTWDQLGATGEWSGQAIHPYSGLAFEAPAYFFSQTVMKGSVLWNEALRQCENDEDEVPSRGDEKVTPKITRHVDAYQKVVDAVGADRQGIGLAGAGYRNPHAKLVALAVEEGEPFVEATGENVANLSYPLARPVRFYINKGSTVPANPDVIEFLRFILSREGQALVAREGDFLALPAAVAREELAKLE